MYHHFLESVSSKQGALATWAPISRWMGEKFAVLAHEENYAFVMGHFCDSVDSAAFPNSSGVKVTKNPRWLKVTFRGGCPEGDPSFAKAGEIMLANGLGCLAKTECLSTSWLAALRDNLSRRAASTCACGTLFSPEEACNIPYVERSGRRVLPYSSYRFGLYLDFLMNERAITDERKAVVMEVGAGWGGFAALLKGRFPSTRYVILDIPTSSVFQKGFFHRLGYKKILALHANATAADAHRALCCTEFDFLFISPHHFTLLPDDAVDVTVNFDSMIEMPVATIDLYIGQIARVSRAFYYINRNRYVQSLMQPRFQRYMLAKGTWNLTHNAMNRLQWRAPRKSSMKSSVGQGEAYVEQYL